MYPELKYTKAQIADYLNHVTPEMVKATLHKAGGRGFFDLLNLISPVGANFIPEMTEIAQRYRRMYYGKTVRIYAPLYISNICINSCKYCDFNCHNKSDRKELDIGEIIEEAKAIKAQNIDSLLLVAGEDPRRMTADFLAEVAKEMRKIFSYLSIEVAPMSEADYRKLFEAGVEGVTLYQETYDKDLYLELHPAGPKRDYTYRLGTQMRAGQAGMRNLGMGFLLGLYDWRLECASLAAHAVYIMKHCWRSKIQFSFPRITPISEHFVAPAPVEEHELEQMMLAFRVVFPEEDMTISTRECAEFRDRMVKVCAGNMSAGSKVTPGGYAILADQDIGQFSLNDNRSVNQVVDAIERNGQQVVRKFWDRVI